MGIKERIERVEEKLPLGEDGGVIVQFEWGAEPGRVCCLCGSPIEAVPGGGDAWLVPKRAFGKGGPVCGECL